MGQTAAERKQEQRIRLAEAVQTQDASEWTEAVCFHVLQSAQYPRGGALDQAAWEQLGRLRGYSDRQQPLL